MYTQKGFTLIELMVVIAIIGLLSSVVLASLSTARSRARDTSVMQEVNQLANTMELEYLNSGNYGNMFSNWDYTAANCSDSYSGTLAAQARTICANIATNIPGGQGFYTGAISSGGTSEFTIMAYLSGADKAYCVSSKGGKSSSCAWGNWSCSGCYSNP